MEALANDMRGLGMDLRVSAEEYGPERDFAGWKLWPTTCVAWVWTCGSRRRSTARKGDGTITRTITFSFKIAQQDD